MADDLRDWPTERVKAVVMEGIKESCAAVTVAHVSASLALDELLRRHREMEQENAELKRQNASLRRAQVIMANLYRAGSKVGYQSPEPTP